MHDTTVQRGREFAVAPIPPLGAGEARASLRRVDALLVLGALLVVLAWDAGGADLAVSRRFGGADGFPWRDLWLLDTVLHTGARQLAWVVGAVLLVGIWRPIGAMRRLSRAERVAWLGATLACAALVPLLKQTSLTSCPWSLAEFGGGAQHVSHWLLGHADGGPGRCFPAGHPSAAFAFLTGWFALRAKAPRAARRWLLATVVAGVVLGAVQVVRGAHFVSHVLWTAWCCWALSAVLHHAIARRAAK